jgi:clan AA aspartic protease (TIGR02281 family)
MAIRTTLVAALSLAVWLSAAAAAPIDWSGCDAAKGDEAIAACGQLIKSGKLSPNDLSRAYLNRGLAEKSKSEISEAIADFDRAIRLNPKDANAYLNRGIARRFRSNLRGAIADLDQAIKLKPDYSEAYSQRAVARGQISDFGGVIADLTRLMQLDPNFRYNDEPDALVSHLADAYAGRGYAKKQRGDLRGALADLDQAIQLAPKITDDEWRRNNNSETYRRRGEVRKAIRDFDGAFADYSQAIAILGASSDAAWVYIDRAAVRQLNSDLDGAIADLSKAIEINQNNPQAYTERGGLWEIKGDYDRARADYSAAVATKTYTGITISSAAKQQAQARLAALNPLQQIKVPLNAVGGILEVPVEINGAITINFVVDSGASDVTIPADVVSTLLRMGTIKPADFIGKKTYVMADGSESPSSTFMIRSLKVGDKVVENVRAGVTSAKGDPLLGQSFLQHFKSWKIDNLTRELLLEPAN